MGDVARGLLQGMWGRARNIPLRAGHYLSPVRLIIPGRLLVRYQLPRERRAVYAGSTYSASTPSVSNVAETHPTEAWYNAVVELIVTRRRHQLAPHDGRG